ncbi:unnamed protein product [Sphagnum compactum]
MSSLDSCLTYCVVITSFLAIIFSNLASDHPFVHGQPTNFSFTSFDSNSIDEIILLDDAAQYFSDYVVLNALDAATGTDTGCVEFDTFQNPELNDPSNNHVGVDVNSFSSVSTYNLCNLTSNPTECTYLANPDTNFTAWIDYDATTEVLDVWLANGSSSSGILKPNQPVIHFNLNQSNSLSKVFSDAYMYVGFSGSIGEAREANKIMSWSFASSGLPVPPSLPSASPRLGPAPFPSEASRPANSSTGVPCDIIIASAVVIIVLLLLVLACVIWSSRRHGTIAACELPVSSHGPHQAKN